MQTIVILVNPGKLTNPDLDLRYCIPERIEEVSKGAIRDNGYDYIDTEEGQPGPLMGIWLETESAEDHWPVVEKLFRDETFLENDLSAAAEIYISEQDTEALENCVLVFPK